MAQMNSESYYSMRKPNGEDSLKRYELIVPSGMNQRVIYLWVIKIKCDD